MRAVSEACGHCGDEFEPLAPTHVFCSRACSVSAKGGVVEEHARWDSAPKPVEVEDLQRSLHLGYSTGQMMPNKLPGWL